MLQEMESKHGTARPLGKVGEKITMHDGSLF